MQSWGPRPHVSAVHIGGRSLKRDILPLFDAGCGTICGVCCTPHRILQLLEVKRFVFQSPRRVRVSAKYLPSGIAAANLVVLLLRRTAQ